MKVVDTWVYSRVRVRVDSTWHEVIDTGVYSRVRVRVDPTWHEVVDTWVYSRVEVTQPMCDQCEVGDVAPRCPEHQRTWNDERYNLL